MGVMVVFRFRRSLGGSLWWSMKEEEWMVGWVDEGVGGVVGGYEGVWVEREVEVGVE